MDAHLKLIKTKMINLILFIFHHLLSLTRVVYNSGCRRLQEIQTLFLLLNIHLNKKINCIFTQIKFSLVIYSSK